MAAPAQGTATEEEAPPRGETRKLFVGGVPAAATETDLLDHFARFGEVRSVVVMRDRDTGHGRGFGFVEFVDEGAAARALGDGDGHYICGRLVEVKRARTRPPRTHDDQQPPRDQNQSYESKKLFIGGLRDNVTEEEFKAYFETFGTVTDVVVIYDSLTNKSRGFGFVTFDSEEAVNKVMRQSFHNLNGTKVEAKIAIPKDDQYYRNGRGRGGRSFGGVRGPVNYEGGPGPMYQPYYMPQPVPAHPFYPYFPVAAYPYGNGYPSGPGMMARQIPPTVYGAYPHMYPGFNMVSRSGFGAQTTADMQDVSAAGVATKLEHMKLGPQ